MENNTPRSGAGLAIGFGLAVLGLIVFVDSLGMQVPPTYARVGPQAFPYFIAAALAAVGAYFVWNAWAPGAKREIVAEGFDTDWRALLIIGAGLLIHLNILKPLGFVISGIFLFLCVAFAFGSRNFLRDGIVAVILVLASYLGFTHGLGLQLPPGILAGVL
ncbi:tripartite tricarboxylate transporter TctB family protein [Taklimakanibacter deserti]|uniref:tripartite tricarboxylate transporter TctB family protein n=1 Tax=Taklimakanibacter deserti TaxID=2267839 RepID=UPI0013C4676E